MTRRAVLLAGTLAVRLGLAGCERGHAAPTGVDAAASPATGASTSQAGAGSEAPPAWAKATTSEAIYLANLDAEIGGLTKLAKEHPDSAQYEKRLAAAHYIRGRFRGDLDEIQAAVDGATACISKEPANAGCFLMRAEQEQSLHRFKDARGDLTRAEKLGADAGRIAALTADLDWNDGLYDQAIAAIRKARREGPSTATLMREAQLDHDLGNESAADPEFAAAEALIVDTSPIPVVHLDVQRGLAKQQLGLVDEARVFFQDAVVRMPSYVAGNEHLAESLHGLGRDDQAMAIYEKVSTLSDDPEFMHALASLYAAHGKKEEAEALEAKARSGYQRLLEKYPDAMYWHASEFYLATGDNRRALVLLRRNLTLRPGSPSYVALARADLANGLLGDARTAIDKALAMPVRSALLFGVAEKVYAAGGDAAHAAEFHNRARAINPRFDVQSGASE